MGSCRHSLAGEGGDLCMLTSSMDMEDGGRALVFHGSTPSIPLVCDAGMFKLCPFKVTRDGKGISSRGTVRCEHCGKAHVPGSTSGRTCREWSSFKDAYREMRNELPGKRKFFLAGTTMAVYSDECDEFLRRQLWNKVQLTILRRDRFICQDCGRSHREVGRSKNRRSGLEVHHIVPRSLGGTDHPGNLKTVCRDCHREYTNSGNKLIREARAEEELSRPGSYGGEGQEDVADVDDLAFE